MEITQLQKMFFIKGNKLKLTRVELLSFFYFKSVHYKLRLEMTRSVFSVALCVFVLFYYILVLFVIRTELIDDIQGYSKNMKFVSIRCNCQKRFLNYIMDRKGELN